MLKVKHSSTARSLYDFIGFADFLDSLNDSFTTTCTMIIFWRSKDKYVMTEKNLEHFGDKRNKQRGLIAWF